jgi:DNA polymerase-3 subunit beta
MKVTCVKRNIQDAAILSEKIAGRNPTLPILNTILIYTQNKNLNFLTTNLEMALEISFPCKTEKEGKVAVPAKLFSGFISSLTEDNVKLESSKDNLILTTNNSSTTVKGYPVKDFPVLPKIKEKKSFNVSVDDFVSGLKSVYYSASLSEMKPELNSVFVSSVKNNPLTFVATDSFRLAEKNFPYNFSQALGFLIPYRSVIEIIRVFENQEGDMKVVIDDNNVVLESNNIRFTSRLTEGNFPDYKQIIPNKFTNNATVDKKSFTEFLRTASMFCGKLNEVKIRIYKDEKFLEIQTNNPDLGEHTVSVKGDIDGDDLTIMFNHRYLMDCLGLINSEKILLKFSGEGRPLLISGLEDNSFSYLIMPMKDL